MCQTKREDELRNNTRKWSSRVVQKPRGTRSTAQKFFATQGTRFAAWTKVAAETESFRADHQRGMEELRKLEAKSSEEACERQKRMMVLWRKVWQIGAEPGPDLNWLMPP